MPVTFGIEEEFVLLDRPRLEAVDLGAQAVAALSHDREDVADTIVHEFFASQLEHATPVCTGFADAWEAVVGFRRRLGEWVDAAGVIAAGSGTPFRVAKPSAVTADERYERIAHDIGGLTAEHQINGLHVHVGIPDRDAGVHISNGLRPWLPVLLALSANSPFWEGADMDFDSWRTIHSRRWTTYGIPPLFRDAADYDRAVASLRGLGATSDPGTINWNVRLSPRLPTVEIRVCDAQLDPESAVALALTVRALAGAALASAPVTSDATPWDAALWHTARHGLRAGLLHPLTGRPSTAAAVLQALRERIAPHLADAAERHAVERLLSAALGRGNGAAQQRSAKRRGIPALADLYRRRLTGGHARGRPGAGAGDRAHRSVRMSSPSPCATALPNVVSAGEEGAAMTVTLNEKALSHARGLLRRGEVTYDDRDDWSEHAPSTDKENRFIDERGMPEFALWHLGEDTDKTEGTKGRYLFPYGDFATLHRCAVISGESRAGQYDHASIETALKELLTAIDKKNPDSDDKERKAS